MKQIRRNVFETNSSSTHTLSIVTSKEWDEFKNGKYATKCMDEVELIPVEGDVKSVMEDEHEKIENGEYQWYDKQYFTYDEFMDNEDYDRIVRNVENSVVISTYGYD